MTTSSGAGSRVPPDRGRRRGVREGPDMSPSDRTIIEFDRPDERRYVFERLIPFVRREDSVTIGDENHVVRSSTLVIDPATGRLEFYVRLRL